MQALARDLMNQSERAVEEVKGRGRRYVVRSKTPSDTLALLLRGHRYVLRSFFYRRRRVEEQ